MRIDQAGLLALLRNDQRDLAARYHAQTDGERIIGLEAHQLCAEAAADDLGQDRDNGQHDREAEHLDGQTLQIGLDADGREEQRREQHIAEHVGLACDIVAHISQRAEDDAGEICAGDVGDAEEALCNVAHQQGERNRINRDAAVLVPFLLHLEERLVHDQADDRNEYEERYNAGQNEQRAYRRIGQRAQNGQDDDAQNIVDNGRAQYRCADPAFQLAHLAQRLDRDRNRGCGQNDTDERRLDHVHLIARVVVERKIASHAAEKRYDDADHCNDERGEAGLFQLLQIGIHARIEHQNDNAELSCLDQEVSLAHPVEHTRADQNTGDQCADDLRHVNSFARQTENFRRQQDDRYRQKIIVRHYFSTFLPEKRWR